VRIADDLRKAVVFLGEDIAGPDGEADIDPRGTGFFITWRTGGSFPTEDEEKEYAGNYLVTAKHNTSQLGRSFVIRFNKTGGGSDIIKVDDPRW
jgi:hypothetical protein